MPAPPRLIAARWYEAPRDELDEVAEMIERGDIGMSDEPEGPHDPPAGKRVGRDRGVSEEGARGDDPDAVRRLIRDALRAAKRRRP